MADTRGNHDETPAMAIENLCLRLRRLAYGERRRFHMKPFPHHLGVRIIELMFLRVKLEDEENQ